MLKVKRLLIIKSVAKKNKKNSIFMKNKKNVYERLLQLWYHHIIYSFNRSWQVQPLDNHKHENAFKSIKHLWKNVLWYVCKLITDF